MSGKGKIGKIDRKIRKKGRRLVPICRSGRMRHRGPQLLMSGGVTLEKQVVGRRYIYRYIYRAVCSGDLRASPNEPGDVENRADFFQKLARFLAIY